MCLESLNFTVPFVAKLVRYLAQVVHLTHSNRIDECGLVRAYFDNVQ